MNDCTTCPPVLLVSYRPRETLAESMSSFLSRKLLWRRSFVTATLPRHVFRKDTINSSVQYVAYAVRGEIPLKAAEYEKRLRLGDKLPFDSIVWTNIGNPQQQPMLGQEPITFWRQVAALTEYPQLLDMPATVRDSMFPSDVQERARELLKAFGSVGAYTASKGVPLVRQHVSDFLQQRDGYAENIENIYLTAGASSGISALLQILMRPNRDGLLIPIPQYPLYSASASLLNLAALTYRLDAQQHWEPSLTDIKAKIDEARSQGIEPRVIVVINPGNPTGACMTRAEVEDMIKLAHRESLAIFADEVYQDNVYNKDRPFVPFRRVLMELQNSQDASEREIGSSVELVSFHSTSKGMVGECGRRGGFFVLNNMDAEVEAQINKVVSMSLCPPTQGQIGVDLLVRPPKPDEPSYELWRHQIDSIYHTLQSRSQLIADSLNRLPGIFAEPAMGALYVLPRVHLPKSVSDRARQLGKKVDELYCLELLDETGICVVPGSGFSYEPEVLEDGSTLSCFRITVLAKETQAMVDRFTRFHRAFMDKYP